jgi:hypothetical protein
VPANVWLVPAPAFTVGLLGWKESGGKNKQGWYRVPNNADVDNRESLCPLALGRS